MQLINELGTRKIDQGRNLERNVWIADQTGGAWGSRDNETDEWDILTLLSWYRKGTTSGAGTGVLGLEDDGEASRV